MAQSVFAIASSETAAGDVIASLMNAGFADTDISVLFPDKSGRGSFAHEKNTKAPEGAATGAGAGAVVGGALGLLAGIGAMAIPGLGPFIAAGPIMAALSGMAVGGAVGGITGALIGLGIPELEAKRYEDKVRGGNILLAVHAEESSEVKRAKEILEAAGCTDISSSSEKSAPDTSPTVKARTPDASKPRYTA